MPTQYINSNNITIYPSGFRDASVDLLAGQNTEQNLTNTKQLSKYEKNNCFSFFDGDEMTIYIKGYFFNTLKSSIPTGNNLYAYIKLVTIIEGNYQLATLVNVTDSTTTLDSAGEFKGLAFDTSVPVNCVGVKVRDASGNLIEQPLKLSSDEIRNKDTDDAISKKVTTDGLEVTYDVSIGRHVSVGGNADVNGVLEVTGGIIGNVTGDLTGDVTGDITTGNNSAIKVNGLISPTQTGNYHLISKGGSNKPKWEKDIKYIANVNLPARVSPDQVYRNYKFNCDSYVTSSDNLNVQLEIIDSNNFIDTKTIKFSSINSAVFENDTLTGNPLKLKFSLNSNRTFILFTDGNEGSKDLILLMGSQSGEPDDSTYTINLIIK